MARVDVVVPCYRYGHFLEECVHSVLAQDGVDVRVLILDDASPDDTEAVGRRLAGRDPRVMYRRHSANMGHIATYNEGLLGWADGDYALLLSADDVLTPGALRRAARLMDARPEVGMTYGDVIPTATPDFTSVPVPTAYEIEVAPGPVFIEASCRALSTEVETVTAVVRTSVQRAVGGYRKELPYAGDQEMWLRFASVSAIGRVQAPQGFYRQHDTSMSTGYVVRKRYDQVRAAFDCFFREFGARVPDRDRLVGLFRRSLAAQVLHLANKAFDADDSGACSELLTEAESLWPGIRRHREWQRLRLKRTIGGRLCRALRRLRGRGLSPAVP